jgi:hypothetical protein
MRAQRIIEYLRDSVGLGRREGAARRPVRMGGGGDDGWFSAAGGAGTAALLALLVSPTAVASQAPASYRAQAPYLFVDCRRCDLAHLRQEIPFVNHVRDPADAQVQVLVADEQTAGGGRRYILSFRGRREFEGLDLELSYTTPAIQTEAEERDGLTSTLKRGLVPYVAQTSLGPHLDVVFHAPTEEETLSFADPWNHWTFEPYGGGNFNVETSQAVANARYGIYADRVTEAWKIRLRPYFNNNVRIIRREGAEDVRVDLRRHGFDSYLIRSVGPRMGVGVFGDYITTTSDNLRHRVNVSIGGEYNLYPYTEASRRQITFTYRIGSELADYFEETIYEQTAEALLNHSLNAAVEFLQPWGSISSGLNGSSYLHDSQFHRLTFNGNVAFRLGRGVSLNVGSTFQRINDQLALPRGDASLEDILLERRQLATAYRASGQIALSYTFGSIYTNIVNPRF